MVPTFIGTTMLVFFILMNAPGNPFEKARLDAMQQMAGGGETVADSVGSGGEDGNSGLSPEAEEQLRKQFGLDKPVIVRYLIWMGLWKRLIDDKKINLDYPYEITDLDYYERYKVSNPGNTDFKLGDFITLAEQEKFEKKDSQFEAIYQKVALQKWLKVKKDENGDYIVLESGAGSDFKFTNQYSELPRDPESDIYTWYKSKEWEVGEIEEDSNNKYDEGEEFSDLNKNGEWDGAEPFIDKKSGTFIKYYNYQYDEGEEFTDTNNNGKWDSAEPFIDKKIKTAHITKHKFSGVLQGDLGVSDHFDKPVSDLIQERVGISLYFGIIGFILSYAVCIPLGIAKAIKNGTRFDMLSRAVVFIGYSIPGYVLGATLLLYFSDTFPAGGMGSDFEIREAMGFFEKIKDTLRYTFLPILAYAIGSFASLTVLMKNSVIENLSQDYVRTAFSKGLSEKRVIFYHAVRNSLIPIATGIGGLIGIFLTGSYLIEKTFDIHGIGMLSYRALLNSDYAIVMAFLVLGTLIRLFGNLISDLCYAAIDPRIRFK